MALYYLCTEQDVAVALEGSAGRLCIHLVDGSTVAFVCKVEDIQQALEGRTLQLSSETAHCLLEPRGTEIRAEYSLSGHTRKSCTFAASKLREALEDLLRQP